MISAALFATSLALVMLALALALWVLAIQRASSSTTDSFLTRRASNPAKTPAAVQRRLEAQAPPRLLGAIEEALKGYGIKPSARSYALLVLPTLLTCCAAALSAGWIAGVIFLALGATITYLVVWIKQQKYQRKLVTQMPSLMDAMIRLIVIGNSIQAAFQSSIPNVPLPLRTVLEHSSRLMRAGVDLDQALFQVARLYRIDELILFAAVMRMTGRYGGRADAVLERMSNFMRDREEAERELLALSSETRMSAWVLGLLPITIGLLIGVVNANYVASMWFDATGRKLMLGALALQVFGAISLYRLARLK